MFQVDFGQDPRSQQIIRRRQQEDQERKDRFFAPKVRTMGIDLAGIQKQVDEKNHLRSMEGDRERRYAEHAKATDELVTNLTDEAHRKHREELQAMNDFRLHAQTFDRRREFDLNNPRRLQVDRPPRVGDQTDCGVSALQKFDGEDLLMHVRVREQQRQARLWQLEHERDLAKKKAEEDDAKRREVEYLQKLDQKMRDQEVEKDRVRRQQAHEMREYNLQKIREKEASDKRARQKVPETVSLLTPAMADVRKDLPHTWTFMSADEKQRVVNELRDNEQDALRRKQQEEEEKRMWDEQALNIMTAQERLVEDQEHQKRDKARQIALENLKKAEEDKEREKYRNNELYTNRPTKDFFDQFNTSSR